MRSALVTINVFIIPFAASAQTIEQPAPKVGDECHYDVLDNQNAKEKIAERHAIVSAVDTDHVTITWTQEILVSRDTGDIEAGTWVYDKSMNNTERNNRKFDPAYPQRFYPLSTGAEKKNVTSKFRNLTNGTDVTTTLHGKVGTWEKLTVPAGTFDILKINWNGHYVAKTDLVYSWTGTVESEVVLSPTTWCQVSGKTRTTRPNGGTVNDRSQVLTSFKN
jgi:tellurite resistance-related uncharacterized protein